MSEPENVIIRTDGSMEECLPTDGEHYSLAELQQAIGGGYIEVVYTRDGRVMVLDEEGKLKGFPRNTTATSLHEFGDRDPVVGDVLVCEAWRIE